MRSTVSTVLRALTAASLLVVFAGSAYPQSIFTIAGGGLDGRPGTAIGLNPKGIATDQQGDVFLADSSSHRIRRLDASTGIVTTVAGNGTTVYSAAEEGAPALSASLNSPYGVALDGRGNLYIADTFHNRVRMVDAETGTISTIAGVGGFGFGGDGGPATLATLNRPEGIVFDGQDHLYIGERNNHRVRRIDLATGIITTVAGNGEAGSSEDGTPATGASLESPVFIAVDSDGALFIAETDRHRVRRVDPETGLLTTVAGNGSEGFSGDNGPGVQAMLDHPHGLAVDDRGALWIADSDNLRVRRLEPGSGLITTVAGSGNWGYDGDGGLAVNASFKVPAYLAVDAAGNLLIGDDLDNRIRRVDFATSIISTVAGNGSSTYVGDGGLAEHASFARPSSLAVDSDGNIFIADAAQQRVRRIDALSGVITTVAGGQWGSDGDEGPATEAGLKWPAAIALDELGNLYVGDRFDHRVRRVDLSSGVIHPFAGDGSEGSEGDGGLAVDGQLESPDGLVVDGDGMVYIADSTADRVRQVDVETGIITTLAGTGEAGFAGDDGLSTQAMLHEPLDLSIDAEGNLFVVDHGNHRVRRISRETGIITTVAGIGTSGFQGDGQPATLASLSSPGAVFTSDEGDLFIADTWNHRLRVVDGESDVITTVAGNGAAGFLGDGGPATMASLNIVYGLALDIDGSILIADTYGNRVRRIPKCVELGMLDLTTPFDGSQGLPVAPSLGWNRLSGAFRYDVYLDTVNPPSARVAAELEVTSFAPSNLEPLTTYHWQVVARGDPFCPSFETSASAVWSFTTTSECEAPGTLGLE